MALDFSGNKTELIENEVVKPSPTEYPALLPTLQTWAGMVLGNGSPAERPVRHQETIEDILTEAKKLYEISHLLTTAGETSQNWLCCCEAIASNGSITKTESETEPEKQSWEDLPAKVRGNLTACVGSVTKIELLDYISHKKRIDTEQAVAMAIAYLRIVSASDDFEILEKDDLDDDAIPAVEELINDTGVLKMLADTTMWREEQDHNLLDDPREASATKSWLRIAQLSREIDSSFSVPEPTTHTDMISYLQTLRRRRTKLGNTQHLTFPNELLPAKLPLRDQWSWNQNYKTCTQTEIPIARPLIISKHRFRTLQTLLHRLGGPTDVTSIYVLDVERFTKTSGSISPQRLAALAASEDPYALAYSFITAQRHRQLTVVSDPLWTRFLIKGEGAMILQNRPDVLTSFEDILVRRATDLRALSAVWCPKGVRDNFSLRDDVLQRTRKICEFMERYVRDFGAGRMENLVFNRQGRGGSGRGPVDVYNALCDELKDCKARARALDMELEIGHVQKFLAKDIMHWNNAWGDDAFANGKIPGWVEYLARVRLHEMQVS